MLKLLKNLNKRDYIYVFISAGLIVFQVWLELKMPDYMSNITQLVQTRGASINDILREGSYMLLCAFGSLVSAFIVGYFTSTIAASFSYRTRGKLFRKVEDISTFEVKKFSPSSLITRTTNDITQIEFLIAMGLTLMIKAPITAVWAVTKILNKNIEWSILTGVAVLVLLITIGIIMMIVMPKFKIVQELMDKINMVMRENLSGIRVVRAFNAEKYQEDKFENVNNTLTNQQVFNQKAFNFLSPVMYLVMYFLTLGIYFIGAMLINEANMGDKIVFFGNMIVFSSYAMQVIMSFLMLAMIFMMLPRASVSAKRINEVLDTPISVKEGNVTMNNSDIKGCVEFKNVSFKYPDADEYVLLDISFKVNKGETIAFIGSTGSGKSTLINLIPRFYDATSGEILINGIDVRDYSFEYLNNIIGYVPQKATLFSGDILSNVSFGKNIDGKPSNKKIADALRVSQASEFVSKLEDGEKSHIAQGGTNISGGQKQRLSIARTIARNPEIYIFDDSFSALDYKTDSTLRRELREYTKDATVMIVAQRIGTILNADKIVVLDNGKCVGVGTHNELMKKCKVYKEIALSQVSKEELENV
ncbi:MAG: ABC transporter ATP-binding protein [Bacilli bacterium]|nr:ABC transporter ATP-binding protein [Bacilli bacterium]